MCTKFGQKIIYVQYIYTSYTVTFLFMNKFSQHILEKKHFESILFHICKEARRFARNHNHKR
jgi:hypothetical protein